MCPVLAFTPEVEELYVWFHATHEIANADGRVWWRRTSLPASGGAGDQDCRLMSALEYLEGLTNSLLAIQRQPKGPKT